MKRITLESILHSLETMTVEINVDAEIAGRARASVERMLSVGTRAKNRLAA
jgi:quinolinate synthase